MKTVAFIGRVNGVSGDYANVSITPENSMEILDSQCPNWMLEQSGIKVGDEFRLSIDDGKAAFTRLPPKEITRERVEEIRKGFLNRWNF